MSGLHEPTPDAARAKFRTTLRRVLIVQLVSMVVLGLIQVFYNR
jgi:hypothetical protein